MTSKYVDHYTEQDNDGNITFGIDGPSFFSHHHYIQENR